MIELTKDLLKEAPQSSAQPAKGSRWGEVKAAAPTPASAPVLPSILPPQVAQQIRAAQIRAALSGQAPAAWAVGAKCQAMYSADGEFYAATVTAVSASGNFVVLFDAYGNSEEVGWPLCSGDPPVLDSVFLCASAGSWKRTMWHERSALNVTH